MDIVDRIVEIYFPSPAQGVDVELSAYLSVEPEMQRARETYPGREYQTLNVTTELSTARAGQQAKDAV
jgi:hypothetical protein